MTHCTGNRNSADVWRMCLARYGFLRVFIFSFLHPQCLKSWNDQGAQLLYEPRSTMPSGAFDTKHTHAEWGAFKMGETLCFGPAEALELFTELFLRSLYSKFGPDQQLNCPLYRLHGINFSRPKSTFLLHVVSPYQDFLLAAPYGNGALRA